MMVKFNAFVLLILLVAGCTKSEMPQPQAKTKKIAIVQLSAPEDEVVSVDSSGVLPRPR